MKRIIFIAYLNNKLNIFGEDASPLHWDPKRNYTRDSVTIFYEVSL